MIGKRRRRAGQAASPSERSLLPNTRTNSRALAGQTQAPFDEPEVDRRSADPYVRAMLGALRLLVGNRYLRPFLINSPEDLTIEAAKNQLRQAIVRRRRNLRKTVRS